MHHTQWGLDAAPPCVAHNLLYTHAIEEESLRRTNSPRELPDGRRSTSISPAVEGRGDAFYFDDRSGKSLVPYRQTRASRTP
jgi:hypothetical protein